MPAYREEESQMAILNRLPRTGFGCSSGCFENGDGGLATGEQVWAVLSERPHNHREREGLHNDHETGNGGFLRVGEAVSVDLGHRRVRGSIVRRIPCSQSVELCLHDEAATRIVVDQRDVERLQKTAGLGSAPQKEYGIAGEGSWRLPTPLQIDIPIYDNTYFESQDSENAEEKMAAAVLTSLSLSPVLKNIQFQHDQLFEDAMITANGSDEAISPTPCTDPDNNRRSKLRRRKNSSKTRFQCIWPRCGKILTNSSAIVRHVRLEHLGPKKDKEGSYGEEEFYFIEMEGGKADATEHSSEDSHSPPLTRTTSRRCRSFSDPSVPTQPPVSTIALHPHVDDNFIWPLRATGGRGKTKRPLHQVAHPSSRKARGDGKKCRKVFGMENKHLWCTQCRWKKACVKFTD